MINRKIVLIMLTIMFILSIGVISAADSNDTQTTDTTIQTTATSNDYVQSSQEEPETIQKPAKSINKTTQNNTKTATESVQTYGQLYNTLTYSQESNLTVSLDTSGEVYLIENPITLSRSIKNLVVEGNNKYISGNYEKSFLNVNHDCNITFNNIYIQYCRSKSNGAAINQTGGSLLLNNTEFYYNDIDQPTGQASGSAVYTRGTEVTINNSYFESNQINWAWHYVIDEKCGGSVFFDGLNRTSLNIYNTIFYSNYNHEYRNGGALAIFDPKKAKIVNSKFILNNAIEAAGIYYESYMNDAVLMVENCSFENNTCKYEREGFWLRGTAIEAYTSSTVIINKSVFKNNIGYEGSAIHYEGLKGSNLKIIDSVFDTNGFAERLMGDIYNPTLMMDYSRMGGALYIYSEENVNISNCSFKNNKALERGAAIEFFGKNSTFEVSDSTFDSNVLLNISRYNGQGGAIYLSNMNGNSTINNVKFINNSAKSTGALYCTNEMEDFNTSLIINNTLFKSNTPINSSDAGALTIEATDVIIQNTEFISNSGIFGSAYINATNLLMDNTTFDSNIAINENGDYEETAGGLTLIPYGKAIIKNSNFTDNSGSDGGALFLGLPVSTYDPGPQLNDATLDDILNKYGATSFESYNNVSILNTSFTKNKAMDGGAIKYVYCNNSILEIKDSTFDSNSATLNETMEGLKGGGALRISTENGRNTLIIESTNFTNNTALIGSIICDQENGKNEIFINNSLFDSNSINNGTEYVEVPLLLINSGNVTINNSLFTNHVTGNQLGGLIYSITQPPEGEEIDSHLNIDNTNFTSNKGLRTTVLTAVGSNVSINNSNFENNTVLPEYKYEQEYESINGSMINSNSTLTINNTNIRGNGIQKDLLDEYTFLPTMPLIYQYDNILSVDNTNFTDNAGIIGGFMIWIDNSGSDKAFLIVNNTRLEDNVNYVKMESDEHNMGSDEVVEEPQPIIDREFRYSPGILVSQSDAIIDNSIFISNKVISLTEYENYTNMGVISFLNNAVYEKTCNVTNSIFFDNQPGNFIIDEDRIVINNVTTNYIYFDMLTQYPYVLTGNYMFEWYIPNFANVTVTVNNNTESTQYQLESELEHIAVGRWYHDNITDVEIKGLRLDYRNYLYKLVIDQTEDSMYYGKQTFKNNTYYFLLPHNYTISVEATSPVKVGENTTITGKVYYNTTDGEQIVFTNKNVELYINGSYITTTRTNNEGIYEFNYIANVIGTQNVTVKFANDYLPKISNHTKFEVKIRETIININNTDSKPGKATNITIKVTEKDNTPVPGANITILLNNQEQQITLKEDGTYTLEYIPTTVGNNYITATYNGNYTHTPSNKTYIFTTNPLQTIITVTATNTTINNKTTITGKLTDENKKELPETTITLYINDQPITIQTDNKGEFKTTYTTTLPGKNYVQAYYPGNINHTSSINTTTFTAEKINTTTQATITSQKVNNASFNVKIEGKDKNTITNGTITITDKEGNIITTATINNKETPVKIYEITRGTYNLTITYTGNDTYNPSNTTKTITIKTQPQIQIEILNNTEENVQAEITVTDETGTPLPEQTLTITLPNKTTSNITTDTQGKIRIIDTTTPAGNTKITAEIPESKYVEAAKAEKTFTIEPDYQKIIDKMNQTIQQLNETVQEQQKTIKDLEDTIDTLNKTSTIKALPTNGTVDDNKVIVTLDNKMGTPITNAPITVKNSKGETIGTGTTDKDGVAVIPVDTKAGTENVTVSYPGNDKYTPANTTISITTRKNNVLVTVDPIEGIIGENITLTAHVTDMDGNPVSGGNIVFKLNGKTLRVDGRFDSKADPWKFKLNNEKVTVTIKADLYLRNTKNITASYSGTYKYKETKSSPVTAQIKKRNAIIKVTTTPKTQKQYNTITFKATLTDTTPNTKNTTAINTNTKVIFKINGKTIKDKDDNNLLIKVVNQTATYKYTVPQGMGAITKTGETRNYTVEAVMVSETYYPDTRNTTTFNVQRSPTTIDISKVSVNSKNQLSVKASIKDYKNKNVIGNSTVAIKINGKTYVNPKTGKTENFKVTNGKISLSNIQVSRDINIKKVMIVTGARQAYLGQRNETSSIVKV